MNKMRLGILVSGLETDSLKKGIKLAKEIGYGYVEVSACKDDNRPNIASLTKAKAKEIVTYTRDLGLEISAFQCHFHQGYALLDKQIVTEVPFVGTWKESIEHTKRIIELANYLSVGIVHTVSGILPELDRTQRFEYTGNVDYPSLKEWQRLLEAYRIILDFASQAKVKIGIEPVFAYIVGNYYTTKKLFEDIGRDDLYLNFDPGHFPYHNESPIPIIKGFGRKIIHTHVKDGKILKLNRRDIENGEAWIMKSGEEEFKFAPPGKGVLDWKEIIANLKEVGYDGVLSLEMGHGYEGW